tara:strand:- start:5520 stop:6122 length:603 start_codon:yes stop_codon:yes gene_type:complete
MPPKICKLDTCENKGVPQDLSNYYRNPKGGKDGYDKRCKACVRKIQLARYHEDPAKHLERHKSWRARGGLEKMNAYQRNWRKNNMTPERKIRKSVSVAVYLVLKKGAKSKGGSTFAHLPYTPAELKEHIEKQFDRHMSWENYGTYWNLDHIIPQAALSYNSLTHPNFEKCWALNNLRPLEAKLNSSKGSLHEGKRHYHTK